MAPLKIIIAKYVIVALLLSAAFLSSKPTVSLEQNDLSLSFNWSETFFFQGELGNVTISIESFCPNELIVNWIGICFSWMDENSYYALDLTDNPQTVFNVNATLFGALEFKVPLDVPTGLSQFYVMIYFKENESDNEASRVWVSSTYEIQIHSNYEKIYIDSNPFISNLVKTAQYEAEAAKTLHVQAEKELNYSALLADQSLWEEAVTHLLNSSNILAEASRLEDDLWRDRAFESINTVKRNISQLSYECLEAESLLSQAQSSLLEAESSYNKQTLDGFKDAVISASEASSQAELASAEEQSYYVKKQEATSKLYNATRSLNQLVVQSPASKELLAEAQELLSRSQDALLTRSLDGCESAYLAVEQALSKMNQAIEEENIYQVQVQQKIIIITGTFAIGAFGLYLIIKPKNIGFNSFFASLSRLSSLLIKKNKTEPPNDPTATSQEESKRSTDNLQDDETLEQLIKQASNLCGDELG